MRLSDFGLRREPPRPVHDRQPGYELLFDFDTLFYDVFRSGDGQKIICLGPPLLNCERFLAGVRFRLDDSSLLKATYRQSRLHLQPSCRYEVAVPDTADPTSLKIEAGGNAVTVPVRRSGSRLFEGRRVVMTMIKDTPMHWIRDWAQFHVRIHGADSVIIYDNGSSAYRADELQAVLDSLDAPGPHLAVRWDFPYGPNVGPGNVQDSFYCQPGYMDHARRRYCASARSVLNCDIDELVVGPVGQSVFEEAEQASGPGLHIHGRWVETLRRSNRDQSATELIRHADCLFAQRKQSVWRWLGMYDQLLRTKWVAVPARCDDRTEWTVHSLTPTNEQPCVIAKPANSTRFIYRHFRQLTAREHTRRRYVRRYNPIKHQFDRELFAALQNSFGAGPGRSNRVDDYLGA